MGRLLIPAGLEEKEQRHEVQSEKVRGHSHRVFTVQLQKQYSRSQGQEREMGPNYMRPVVMATVKCTLAQGVQVSFSCMRCVSGSLGFLVEE